MPPTPLRSWVRASPTTIDTSTAMYSNWDTLILNQSMVSQVKVDFRDGPLLDHMQPLVILAAQRLLTAKSGQRKDLLAFTWIRLVTLSNENYERYNLTAVFAGKLPAASARKFGNHDHCPPTVLAVCCVCRKNIG